MAYDFRLPDLGEGIAQGTLVRWLVKEGDTVLEHQEIAELETDKALVKVPSPKAGVIISLNATSGGVVHVGEILCSIGTSGEKPKKVSSATSVLQPSSKKSTTVMGELEEAPETPVAAASNSQSLNKKSEPLALALPSVRKLAQELGVDLSSLQKLGRITEDDVRTAAGKKEKTASINVTFEQFGRVLRIPLKGMRKAIADNMTKSISTAAHVTHMDYIDVTLLSDFREKHKEQAENKGVHLTFLPFIIKACGLALKEFPYVNASFDDEKKEIVLKQYFNIGFAVDTQQGLLVPVIKNADAKTIIELGRDIWKLAELARSREIEVKDLQGGTFTVTNIGSIGGVFATPIIHWPECAILGLGKIADTAVPVNNKFEVRKMLPVSFSFDHRIIDGAMAAKFVNEIKRHLENPDALFMGY